MNEIINQLAAIKDALGTLTITSTRHNLDCVLGSMQIVDKVIEQLGTMDHGKGQEND